MAKAFHLKVMAQNRIAEADLLVTSKFYDAAFYLAGYAIEYGLKAVICKRLGVEMFEPSAIPRKLSQMFHIHGLFDLIILAGLKTQLEDELAGDARFATIWSVVAEWSEQRRYDCGCSDKNAINFIESVKKFLSWIERYW